MHSSSLQPATWPAENSLPAAETTNWYALYTCSRHEKQVAAILGQRDVPFFLPLYHSIRRWKDRRVNLQLPLFPGYIFVNIAFRRRFDVLSIPGAVRFVAFNGRPAALNDAELAALRNGLDLALRAQPYPYLKTGCRVRVCSGPLCGMEGILIRRKQQVRLVVSLHLIMRSVAIELDAADVVPVH
jgi:transcription antitermination factor NusG